MTDCERETIAEVAALIFRHQRRKFSFALPKLSDLPYGVDNDNQNESLGEFIDGNRVFLLFASFMHVLVPSPSRCLFPTLEFNRSLIRKGHGPHTKYINLRYILSVRFG